MTMKTLTDSKPSVDSLSSISTLEPRGPESKVSTRAAGAAEGDGAGLRAAFMAMEDEQQEEYLDYVKRCGGIPISSVPPPTAPERGSNVTDEPRRPANEMWGSLGGQRNGQRRPWPSLAPATGWALLSQVKSSVQKHSGQAVAAETSVEQPYDMDNGSLLNVFSYFLRERSPCHFHEEPNASRDEREHENRSN